LVPGQFERSTTSVDPKNYLTMLKNRIPFVDGGIFAVTKRVLAVCPLNDNLRWGECEDVEWCNRARAHGFLIDMCPEMTATNAVSKVTSLARLPRPAAVFVRTASRAHKRAIRLAQRLKSQFSSKNGDIA
jgi:GT2 family glycosyltransferase